jgi:hypothetical protein
MRTSELESLLTALEVLSNIKSDGHYTIFKFTTGWKIMFGTPNLDIGREREIVRNLPAFKTLDEALEKTIELNLDPTL